MTNIPIIDTHQHLWDLDRFRLPWLEAGSPLARSHRMEDYLSESAGLNVVKTVYMEVDLEPSQRRVETEYIIDLCSRDDNPMTAAVIGGDPSDSGFAAYVEAFGRNPFIKGVRQVLHGPQPHGYCLSPEFVEGVRGLGEKGLSFDFCVRPAEIPDAAQLASLCPDNRFILDHCGNADVMAKDLTEWKRDMEAAARCENMVCKISGVVASAPPEWTPEMLAPIIDHIAEVFGRDRIMFGSDWPVCTLRAAYYEWVEALRQIVSHWPESDRHKLFHGNAAAFYGI